MVSSCRSIVVVVLMLSNAALAGDHSIFKSPQQWVSARLSQDEQVLCLLVARQGWFFVARENDRMKTGAIIDVTSSNGTPLSSAMSWEFMDGDERHVGKPTPAEVKVSRYFRASGRTFSENVAYRDVHWRSAIKVLIGLQLNANGTAFGTVPKNSVRPPVVATCEVEL